MSIFDRFKRPPDAPPESVITIRNPEVASSMRPPSSPNFSTDAPAPCECGKPIPEVFITTGGPTADANVWRDHPIAVDGWACLDCGSFRYPRPMTPDRVTAIIEAGVAHGQAGRWQEAEWQFARVVWNWPGYAAGHLNYAEATSSRLQATEGELDAAVARRLAQRMVEHYEAAIAGFDEHPSEQLAPGIRHAHLRLAELALRGSAHERAQRHLEAFAAMDGASAPEKARAAELAAYGTQRLDLFHRAAEAIGPFLDLMDRKGPSELTGDERKTINNALVDLEEHLKHAPDRWQSHWVYCKGLFAAQRIDDAFAAWDRAFAAFPDQLEIARDYGNDLLKVGRNPDARAVCRAIVDRKPQDATLWCNLAVAELLCGDIAGARAAIAKSDAIDPNDKVARTIARRLDRGAPFPGTLAELMKGG